MATYPLYLLIYGRMATYLLIYLRGNGHPPDYLGGNTTCTHVFKQVSSAKAFFHRRLLIVTGVAIVHVWIMKSFVINHMHLFFAYLIKLLSVEPS